MQTIRPLKKFLAASAVDAAFPAPADVLTDALGPVGPDILDVSVLGAGTYPCGIVLWPYGLGAAADAFALRVIGWNRVVPGFVDGRSHWTQTVLAAFTCTLGADVGVAGGVVLATERYADAIAIVTEGTTTSDVVRGGTAVLTVPGAGLRAHVRVFTEGFERIQLKFARTVGAPTMNALFRPIDDV